ncbi:hypothetical protein ABPG75_014040 [Micractinium tetrahymenae]
MYGSRTGSSVFAGTTCGLDAILCAARDGQVVQAPAGGPWLVAKLQEQSCAALASRLRAFQWPHLVHAFNPFKFTHVRSEGRVEQGHAEALRVGMGGGFGQGEAWKS